MMRRGLLLVLLAANACALSAQDASGVLNKAYAALRERQYEQAVAYFEEALSQAPDRVAIHQDLAYTLLKIGETEAARDRFAEALKLDKDNVHLALEYAYLCYETKQQAEARRVFARLRLAGNPGAAQAFQNIDGELAAGLARWTAALQASPGNFSAHQELAQLAEQRDDLALAAEHYQAAWQLRPDRRAFLLDLGRVWQRQGRDPESFAALLAASRGPESREAESARELLPRRYPYVYEFQAAIELDGKNVGLRREFAYLLLEMNKRVEAEEQFRQLNVLDSEDMLSAAQLGFLHLSRNDIAGAMPLLDKVLKGNDLDVADRVRDALKMPKQLRKRPEVSRAQTTVQAKELAEKSLEAGYLKDALKYLRIAHENDPIDFAVMLKLGWTHNNLRNDKEAIEWFRLARRSPDPAIAEEATKAFRNLRPGLARFQTTAWAYPFYSSRWSDVFTYAQVKTELKLNRLPFRIYASTRFSGDTKGTTQLPGVPGPQYLSESSFIFAGGVATRPWKGIRGWAEAGAAVSYLKREDGGRVRPDIRGGLTFSRGLGQNMGAESFGLFGETTGDMVYVSRFDNDLLFYSQNKAGWTMPKLGPAQFQFYWNTNMTVDARRFYWANSWENGPGIRFRADGLPPSLLFSVHALQGRYLLKEESPLGKQFTDLRAGFWYAFSR